MDTRKMTMAQQYDMLRKMQSTVDALIAQLLIDSTAILDGPYWQGSREPGIAFNDGSTFN